MDNPEDYWNTLMYWPPEKEYARQSWPQLMKLPYEYPNKKVFIVNEDDQWSHFIADEFALLAKNDGWEVVGAETVPTGTVEYGATLAKIKAQDPAIIVVISLSPAAEAAFLTQFNKEPTNSIIHMPYCPAAPEWLSLSGEYANGVVWSTTLAVIPSAEANAFQEKFTKRFGADTWNVSYSTALWDMMHFWEEAVKAVGKVDDYKAIMDYINTHEYIGFSGKYTFPKETNTVVGGDDLIPAPFYQVQDGKHIQLFPEKWSQGQFIVPSWIKKP
jgi:branched-chain amino acid transport system substrate-binding protein